MDYKYIIKKIDQIIDQKPKVCLILGSGLSDFCNQLKNQKKINYSDVNCFKKNKIEGHSKEFVFGYINKIPILVANGRLHYYEGYTFEEVGVLIKVFNYYKPSKYIITNSTGTVNKHWSIGDFMITQKFLDFSFIKNNKHRYYHLKNQINIKNKKLHYGTYTYTIGPTYETKTEIEEIKFLGGDVVGMSTFPEYMMCNYLKINPIILSCITNYAAGIESTPVKHSHVINNAKKSKLNFIELLTEIVLLQNNT